MPVLHRPLVLLFVSLIVTWPISVVGHAAAAQAESNDESEAPLVIKVYRVLDLVSPVPNYPYEGTYIPGLTRGTLGAGAAGLMGGGISGAGVTTGMGGGMGGMGGGMGGGMMGGTGGGMGGGMFRVGDVLAQQAPPPALGQPTAAPARPAGMGGSAVGNPRAGFRISWGPLMNAITSLIDPDSWEENGGPGSLQPIGGALAVNNTEAVHKKITELFAALRRETDNLRTLSIDAQWLLLDEAQLRGLNIASAKETGTAAQAREQLVTLPASVERTRARITCFNGQTVHLISGHLETKIQGAIPVVGGTAEVGYQPTIALPHLGTLLQVTALILPGDDGVLVDLHSLATRPKRETQPVRLGGDGQFPKVQVDRVDIEAQQLATALRVPSGRPVLVGGMSFAGQERASERDVMDRQLYLVIEVTPSADSDNKK